MEACYILELEQQPHLLKAANFNGRGRFRLNSNQVARSCTDDSSKHTRRAHKKSRNGCLACKSVRVKCDETKPSCSRCISHGSDCVYEPPTKASSSRSSSSRCSEDGALIRSGLYETCLSAAQDNLAIKLLLEGADGALTIQNSLRKSMTTEIEMFQHFATSTYSSLAGKQSHIVLREKILPFATTNASVMHSILSLASSHLMHLQPNHKPHQLANSYHMQRATSLLAKELSKPLGAHNMDIIITNCLNVNLVSVVYDKLNPKDSWIFKDDPNSMDEALRWLDMQKSVGAIFENFAAYLEDSVWYPAFIEDGTDVLWSIIPKDMSRPGNAGIPEPLAELCGIGPDTTNQNNPYHLAVRHLSKAIEIEDTDWASYGPLMCFIGRMNTEFRELLRQKDEKALLLMSFWLTLTRHLKQWWTSGRVTNECHAICMFLEKSKDIRIRTILRYSGTICGYPFDPAYEVAGLDPKSEEFAEYLIAAHDRRELNLQPRRIAGTAPSTIGNFL